jgi:hypothetical protein
MPSQPLPSCLADFIEHRKHTISKKEAPTPKEKKEIRTGVKKAEHLEDMSLKTIIEEKPNKKVVKEYLQKRLDELSAEKMSK